MSRLIVVSNRVSVPDPEGPRHAGGLAVAVNAALKRRDGVWFGWSGRVADTPDEWREAFEQLRDPMVRAELGAHARATVEELYSTPVVARRYGDFLLEVA